MASKLPGDLIVGEKTLRQIIKQKFTSIQMFDDLADIKPKVHDRNRYPDTKEEDEEISTIPDPVSKQPWTWIIEFGIPTITQAEYTGDSSTVITFTYPITCDMQVVDKWDTSVAPLQYNNSFELFIAYFLKALELFMKDRTFGFDNVSHEYLQQVSAVTDSPDDETGGELHSADWSLTVKVTWIKQ